VPEPRTAEPPIADLSFPLIALNCVCPAVIANPKAHAEWPELPKVCAEQH
jgi:hypothetical protein